MNNLSLIASKYNCAVVIIGHMNKSNAGKSLYRSLGSIDIPAIARSVLMVCRDEAESSVRYMIPIKSNLAPEGYPIGFIMDRICSFKWIGKCEDVVSEELIHSTAVKLDVEDWLKDELQFGPKPSNDVLNHFVMLNVYSTRTLYSVKKKLGVKSIKQDKTWYWSLPEHVENDDV